MLYHVKSNHDDKAWNVKVDLYSNGRYRYGWNVPYKKKETISTIFLVKMSSWAGRDSAVENVGANDKGRFSPEKFLLVVNMGFYEAY